MLLLCYCTLALILVLVRNLMLLVCTERGSCFSFSAQKARKRFDRTESLSLTLFQVWQVVKEEGGRRRKEWIFERKIWSGVEG